ncbi:MAG: N-acetylmuramoyl-L-alanine amidase [Gammaproteobacteria bacterium]|nr:N-acetylmuramoyl-L-alanine amidase [Gammaproteobacteria bacterium]
MTPEYIVIHTAAFKGSNCDASRIDEWHKARGWSGIGYHFVILNDKHDSKPDGKVEVGRVENVVGAHTLGINSKSLGICCVGHGDHSDFTEAQYSSLETLVHQLMQKYAISLNNVIGHREINDLIQKGLVEPNYRTTKTCPGIKIDMNKLREKIGKCQDDVSLVDPAKLSEAIQLIRTHRTYFNNARDELDQFLNHPEVIEFLEETS